MTKEELKQEAEEKCVCTDEAMRIMYRIGYIDGAEPREKRIAELEKENAELKTEKIPQLERRIASIRGSHRVDVKKLNARIEQVERLKKENAELKEKLEVVIALKDEEMGCIETDFNTFKSKAKEIIKTFCGFCSVFNSTNGSFDNLIAEAEQFLKE